MVMILISTFPLKPSESPSLSMSPSTAPSLTPIPGCSNENLGGNYCINPKFEGAPVNQQLDGSLGFDAHSKVKRKLFVCEGDCDKDSHCEDGLVCFKRNSDDAPPPPGCTGTPYQDMDYCTYPQLKNIFSGEALDNNGAFIRVSDDGMVKVFSSNGELIWWSSSVDQLVQETALFDIRSDISIHLATHLLYASDYVHSSVFKEFDSSEGKFHADRNTIEIHGSISLAYELLDPFPVSALSRISFNVTLGNGIKVLAICMDDGLTPSIESDQRAETTCLAIGGSSIETVIKNPIRLLEEPSPGPDEIVYSLMNLFPTRSTSVIKYIGFVQVISDNGDIEFSPSFFESIRFYDVDNDGQANGRRLVNIGETCPAGELVATTKAGLQDTLQDGGDFCVSSLTMLNQIVLEEGELCEVNNECRSGLCETNECESRVRSTAPDSPPSHTITVFNTQATKDTTNPN